MLITFMVKFQLFFMANVRAAYLRRAWPADHYDPNGALSVLAILLYIFVSVFMYQGLLDLHGWLYSPNAGIKIGHLPADNFLDFVQTVTMDIVNERGTSAEQLPYSLDMAPRIPYSLDMAPRIPVQTEQHRQTCKTEPSLDVSQETPKHTAV